MHEYGNQNTAAGYAGGLVGGAAAKSAIYDAQSQAQVSQPSKEADAAIARLANQIDALNSYASRLSAVCDRTVGSRPKDAGASNPTSNANQMPLITKLAIATEFLSRITDDVADSVNRLEAFI